MCINVFILSQNKMHHDKMKNTNLDWSNKINLDYKDKMNFDKKNKNTHTLT
jgi:hypothetical protein